MPDFKKLHDPYCNCFECNTNSVDGVLNQRVLSLPPDENSFDLNDLKSLGLKYTAILTADPSAYKLADAAQKLNTAIQRAQTSGTSTVKLTPDETKAVTDVKTMIEEDKTIMDKVSSAFSVLGGLKWIIVAIIAILILWLVIKLV